MLKSEAYSGNLYNTYLTLKRLGVNLLEQLEQKISKFLAVILSLKRVIQLLLGSGDGKARMRE